MSHPRMTCAEATLRSMVDAGADRLFDMPGRGVYPLLNELPKFPQLAHVTAPHEFPLPRWRMAMRESVVKHRS